MMQQVIFSNIDCIFARFFFNDTATTEIYTLSLHDALPILVWLPAGSEGDLVASAKVAGYWLALFSLTSRSEEHTSELQSLAYLVCRLLLEKKKNNKARSLCISARYTIPPASTTTSSTVSAS